MSEKESMTIFQKIVKFTKVFFLASTCLILAFLLIAGNLFPDERETVATDCREFETQWYQVLESGEKIEVDVPGKIEAEWGEVVTLTTIVPEGIQNGENLCFRTIWQNVDIYVDGMLRNHYDTSETRPFGTNSAMRYIFLELEEADAGKEIVYQFSSNSKYAGNMQTVQIGDRASIWFHLLEESGVRTLLSFFLLTLSIFCIVMCIILQFVYKKSMPLVYLAWTIFFCALWMISENAFRQVIFRNISVLSGATYWSLMLIPFPLIIYINDIQKGRYEKIYTISFVYSVTMLVVGTVLQVFDIVQFVEQVRLMHIGIAYSIISLIVTITIDMFKNRCEGYLAVGIGVYGMLVTAIFEIILYWMDSAVTLGTMLGIGLMFLLVMAIIKTGQDMFLSEKKQQQAITAKEAQAKFLANMSHEIRTPINAIIGMNEMILRDSDDEEIQEYADNIKRASNMLLSLVNDVLDFSKIESGQLELVEDNYDLISLMQDEILLLNARVGGKPIEVEVDMDRRLPRKYYGDELRLKQILTNLLSNAVKYTKEGKVTIKVFFQWITDEKINLCFSVSDTGIGIKEEDIEHLFDGFKRLELSKNRNIEGTGLGLNIVKQLVELMQGNIAVKSEYGKGSTFTVFIPQKAIDKQPIGQFDATQSSKKLTKVAAGSFTAPDARILVVDDNTMNLAVVKGLLKRTQVQLDLAKSGAECLELTKQKVYHMILMDHMMPEMDGVETLHHIKQDAGNPNREAVVVALTANAVAGCKEMYLEYGFHDYFSKPIQAEKLEELLVQYLPDEVIVREGKQKKTRQEEKQVKDDNAQMAKTIEAEEQIKEVMEVKEVEVSPELLMIDHELGLSYCMDSEDFYVEVVAAFCEQCEEYLPQLDEFFEAKDWKQYAIITHAMKQNALNIGAENFSKYSLEHELAGKADNEAFIVAEYPKYRATLQALYEKLK